MKKFQKVNKNLTRLMSRFMSNNNYGIFELTQLLSIL